MTNFSFSDIVFATISQRVNMLLNLRLSGITAPRDIYGAIRSALPNLSGLARLSIRNASQGWSTTSAHLFR